MRSKSTDTLQPQFSPKFKHLRTLLPLCGCYSDTKSCPLSQTHDLQHTRLPYSSVSPAIFSNSCPLSQWCHPTISASVSPFSSCSLYYQSLFLLFLLKPAAEHQDGSVSLTCETQISSPLPTSSQTMKRSSPLEISNHAGQTLPSTASPQTLAFSNRPSRSCHLLQWLSFGFQYERGYGDFMSSPRLSQALGSHAWRGNTICRTSA